MGFDHWTRTVDGGIRHCSLHRASGPATIKVLSTLKFIYNVKWAKRSAHEAFACPHVQEDAMGIARLLDEQQPGNTHGIFLREGTREAIQTHCLPSLCVICPRPSCLTRVLIISTACGTAVCTGSLSPISPSSRSRIAGSQPTRYRRPI
jgi:hypothetical protein